MITRTFRTTEDAYAACQCDAAVCNGDTLIVPEEHVIGLAWTWPLAVTEAAGDFHTITPTADALARVLRDSHITHAQLKDAVTEADRRGWPVRPLFRDEVTLYEKY